MKKEKKERKETQMVNFANTDTITKRFTEKERAEENGQSN